MYMGEMMGAGLSAEASWIHTIDGDRPALLLEPERADTSARLWGMPALKPALDRGLHPVTNTLFSQSLPWSPNWWVTLADGRLAVQYAWLDAHRRVSGSREGVYADRCDWQQDWEQRLAEQRAVELLIRVDPIPESGPDLPAYSRLHAAATMRLFAGGLVRLEEDRPFTSDSG